MEILGDGNDLKRPTTSEEEEEEEKGTKTIPGEIIFFEIFTRLPVKSLLQFRSSERKAKAECQIFTLGTESWRKIDPVFPFDIKGRDWLFGSKYSVCVNGAIHWLIQSENFIAAFDLREESFRIMPLPHATIPSGKLYMIQINGLLAVICPNMMEMWVLEDYENRVWIAESIIFPSSCAFPRGTIHTGEILLTPQRISRDGVFIPFYDMKNGSFRIVEITLFPELLSAVDDVEITCTGDYIESILALRRND
ncbi:hypothetical protein F0562_033076 [Nyssa sinensis]|uniref:F-box associated beta-propeller type 3 domain-containing protein n=1 Tax=Nyssa sinensis TaxID=561372 RepID=A0A5J5ATR7_9ASTE|nr:hypothetical protein F0562_033076 [Nyssa sinensis]